MAAANATFTQDHYVPILKCKQGELGALQSAVPDLLVPLVEVVDMTKAASLAAAWANPDDVILVQPLNLAEVEDAEWAVSVEKLFAGLRAANVAAVAVATTYDGPDTVAAIAAIAATDQRGVAIRVDAEEVALEVPAAVQSEIDQLLTDLGVAVTDVDMIVDVGLVRASTATRVTTAEAALRTIPYLVDWRNVVTAFSGFPENLDGAVKGGTTALGRDDAIAYATLISRGPDREPIYGDYAVGTPFYADIPWAPIPSIKYTAGTNWMIHRGTAKADRSNQYISLAQDLVASGHYAGAAFSMGDRYYADVASGHDGPGNPTTYVRAATSHHLSCVLDRLATLGVP